MALVKQKGDYGHTNTSYSDVYILLNSLLRLLLPVQRHQHQGEDGDVGGAHDDRLVQLAPDLEVSKFISGTISIEFLSIS